MAQTEGQEVSGEQERTSRRRSLAFLKATSTSTNALSFHIHDRTFVVRPLWDVCIFLFCMCITLNVFLPSFIE